MRDLSSPTRDRTHIPCSGRWSLNHWTTREVPAVASYIYSLWSHDSEKTSGGFGLEKKMILTTLCFAFIIPFLKFFKINSYFIYLFIYLFIAVLGLRFVRGLSLVAASRGHSSSWCAGLSLSRPLPLQGTGSRRAGSAVVAHGPSCSAACGIFPDQGSNPCPLHWQADSEPLRHQGSPIILFNYKTNVYIFYIEKYKKYIK